MTSERGGLRRLFSLPSSARGIERDIDDEIRFHIESRSTELQASGMTAEEAHRQAMGEYGDLVASRNELARVDRTRLTRRRWTDRFDALRQDVLYGVRTLRKQPGFTLAAVTVLALGIGANATMFGVVDRLLLRPPPHIGEPGRIVQVNYVRSYERDSTVQEWISWPIFMDARATDAFESVAGYSPIGLASGLGADAQSLNGMKVSTNFFATLRVQPAAGRFFRPDEERDGIAPELAVLSHEYWQRAYGADRGVVGRPIMLGTGKYEIVGIAPAGFRGVGQGKIDLWIPITSGISAAELRGWQDSRNGFWMLAVGRLRPGVTRAQAEAAATQILRAGEIRSGTSEARMLEQKPRVGLSSILPREAYANDPDAKVAALLTGVSVLVLLIACANVAGLQLARALRRRREVAVRVALGVSRRRLISQLVIESVLLSVAGGAAALAVAHFGSRLLQRVLFTSFDWGSSLADGRLLAYTMVASLVAGGLTGILPALQTTSLDVTGALKAGVREGRQHRAPARVALLVAQTTLSVVLLVGTGLFMLSLRRVDALPIGMEPDRVIVGALRTTGMHYTTAERLAMYDRLRTHAAAVPGVEAAALSTSLPFSSSWGSRVSIPGRDSLPTVKDGGPYFNAVTSDYFQVMGMRVVRGRGIHPADGRSARVVVLNESIATLYWPGEDAIGKCLKVGGDTMPCSEVIGIVANARRQSLIEDASLQFFLPLEQSPDWVDSRNLVIRPRMEAAASVESIRRQLQVAEPGLPYVRLRTLVELVSPETRSWRLGATMFATFGGLALLLAAVGLYGMLAYDVGQRVHELGVRVALGAQVGDVVRAVLGFGVLVVGTGTVLGLALSLAGGRYIDKLLFQTSPREPVVLIGVLGVLAVVSLLAMIVPTLRATRIDPIVALRSD